MQVDSNKMTKEVYNKQNDEGYIFINSIEIKGRQDKLYSLKAKNHESGEYIAVELYFVHEHNAVNRMIGIVQNAIGKF